MASSDEREIRDAVATRLRELVPGARVVHELNVCGTGSNRIDVAAIGPELIVAVEVKSKKDKLDRLDEQWPAFNACCHHVVVAAHEKHFVAHPEVNDRIRDELPRELTLNHPLFVTKRFWGHKVWRSPRPEADDLLRKDTWMFSTHWDRVRGAKPAQPRAAAMLNMLWAEELREECARHRLDGGSRRTRPDMIADMVWMMTGREICQAVCRQLRARVFAEADPVIPAIPLVPAPKQDALAL